MEGRIVQPRSEPELVASHVESVRSTTDTHTPLRVNTSRFEAWKPENLRACLVHNPRSSNGASNTSKQHSVDTDHATQDDGDSSESTRYPPSPGQAPINNLPYELLIYLFEIAAQSTFTETSLSHEENDLKQFLEYLPFPYVLSRICRSWYRIVYSSPTLWSYIQLVVSGDYRDKFYFYATQVAKHASDVPLSIQIHHPVRTGRRIAHRLTSWLERVAMRVHVLRFSSHQSGCELIQPALSKCLLYGRDSMFRELNVWYPESNRPKFVHPAMSFNHSQPHHIVVNSSQTKLFFESIPTVKLDSLFLRWDTQVYPRVTRLEMRNSSITEKQLIALLSNTPNLSHLSFSLDIKRAFRKNPQDLIPLPKLEVLNLVGLKSSQLWSVLRLLELGTVPLTLALEIGRLNHPGELTGIPEVKAFFRRSHISSCYLKAVDEVNEPWFPKLLEHLPEVRTLYLDNHSYLGAYPLLTPNVCPRLRVLCMSVCKLDLVELRKFLKTHSIQVVRLWNCRVFTSGVGELNVDAQGCERRLSQLVPDTACYKGPRMPDVYLDQWDHFCF